MAGDCFVEIDTPEWEAWSKVKRWPQNDFKINGHFKRGWYFRTAWPTSEFKSKLNGHSAPISEAVG